MTWLHPANGAPLCRAAQPTQGLSSKTLAEDQFLLHALHKSVAPPAGSDESPAGASGGAGAFGAGNGGDRGAGGAYGGGDAGASAADKARRNPKRGPRRLVIVDCRAKMNAQARARAPRAPSVSRARARGFRGGNAEALSLLRCPSPSLSARFALSLRRTSSRRAASRASSSSTACSTRSSTTRSTACRA